MLMPAAVLVVLVLGAIAVDLSVVHLATRDLADAAASAANDAVTSGLDPAGVRTGGSYELDPDRVAAAVADSLALHGLEGRLARADIEVDGDRVVVTLERRVAHVFARSLPGAAGATTITTRGEARVARR